VTLAEISFSPERDQFVTIDYSQRGIPLELASAGSGFLQMLQLLTFFYFVNPHIVLLDEPDAHLHASLQKAMLDLLQEIGKAQGIQFIIATHSKEIINNADATSIIPVSNSQEKGTHLSSYQNVLEAAHQIGEIDNIDIALLVKNKKCLFLEDNTQAEVLKKISRLLGKLVFEGDSQLVVIVRGGVNVTKYYYDLPVLRAFLGSDIKSLSVIDRDFKTDEIVQELEGESIAQGVKLAVLEKSEIESYLLRVPLLTRVANQRSSERGGPSIEDGEIESMLEQALEDTVQRATDFIAAEIIHWSRRQGTGLDYPTAAEGARDFVKNHWSTTDSRLTVCQGKAVLSKINSYLQAKYSVSISVAALLSEMNVDDIDSELKELVEEVTQLWQA
jgi:hypothetical protein